MKLIRPGILLFSIIGLLIVSCTKNVTNNVPGANSSITNPHTTSGPIGQAESGGVINGGGGKGVKCVKDGKQTVEVLDLYEAKTLYNLKLMDFGASEEFAKEKLARVLSRHFWNPHTVEMVQFTQAIKQIQIQEFLDNIRFIDSGKRLKLTSDSYDPTLENGCEPVQIAMYYDESVLLVDKALWEQLNWTNKMGLLAHEALYFLARQHGIINSMSTRKLIGMLFSITGVRPLADGAPANPEHFIDCQIESNGFSRGHFYLYPKIQDQKRGLELLLFNLNNNSSLFRTSAFLPGLTFVQLESSNFSGTRDSTLIKDTYPIRDQIRLNFRGIKDGSLIAELDLLQTASSAISDHFEVSCPLPTNVSALEPQTTLPGRFERSNGDGSVDKLTINRNGSILLEETAQVGGPGGVSNFGLVPFPTLCRYRHHGLVTVQNKNAIEYLVISGELTDLTGLPHTEHCGDYIRAFNRKVADGSVRFSIRKSEFKEIIGGD